MISKLENTEKIKIYSEVKIPNSKSFCKVDFVISQYSQNLDDIQNGGLPAELKLKLIMKLVLLRRNQ